MKWAVAVLTLLSLHAQDLRKVVEPAIPPVCATVVANLSAPRGVLSDADESKLDTARIQQAIDACIAGKAVRLQAGGAHNAFLSGPLQLRRGITLVVDAGAVLFGSRNPRDYDRHAGSCGIID